MVLAVPTGLGVREVEGEDDAVRSESCRTNASCERVSPYSEPKRRTVGVEKGLGLFEVIAAAGGLDIAA